MSKYLFTVTYRLTMEEPATASIMAKDSLEARGKLLLAINKELKDLVVFHVKEVNEELTTPREGDTHDE